MKENPTKGMKITRDLDFLAKKTIVQCRNRIHPQTMLYEIDDAMPTILMVRGWRVFFYSEEGNEPIHVHAAKAECECKLWLRVEEFEIEEAWSHGLSPRLKRELRKIVFDNFELIVEEWNRHLGDHRNAND